MGEPGWHVLRAVGLEFLEKAEQVFRVEQQVAAPLDRVWDAFADAAKNLFRDAMRGLEVYLA